jgi:dienelactone hydrolase
MLRAFIFRPTGPGPFPALVYNHGSERDPSLDFMGELAEASPADDRQGVIVELMIAESDDVLAAADYARSLTYVDHRRVAAAGCSFGGIQAVLAAERSEDIYAAVDSAPRHDSCRGPRPLLQPRDDRVGDRRPGISRQACPQALADDRGP